MDFRFECIWVELKDLSVSIVNSLPAQFHILFSIDTEWAADAIEYNNQS